MANYKVSMNVIKRQNVNREGQNVAAKKQLKFKYISNCNNNNNNNNNNNESGNVFLCSRENRNYWPCIKQMRLRRHFRTYETALTCESCSSARQ
jgi:hypothetical protein